MLYNSVSPSSLSTRAAHSDMIPIKWSSRLKQAHCWGAGRRRRLEFEAV